MQAEKDKSRYKGKEQQDTDEKSDNTGHCGTDGLEP